MSWWPPHRQTLCMIFHSRASLILHTFLFYSTKYYIFRCSGNSHRATHPPICQEGLSVLKSRKSQADWAATKGPQQTGAILPPSG